MYFQLQNEGYNAGKLGVGKFDFEVDAQYRSDTTTMTATTTQAEESMLLQVS